MHVTRSGASRLDGYTMVNYRTWNAEPSRFLAQDNIIEKVKSSTPHTFAPMSEGGEVGCALFLFILCTWPGM